jgi:hypothetical protein
MKKRILAAAIFIILGGFFVYFRFSSGALKNPPPPKDKISQDAAVATALARQSSNTTAIIESNFARVQPAGGQTSRAAGVSPAPAGQPLSLQVSNAPPAVVLEHLGRAVRQYGAMFGGNPVGTNPEITSQLSGNNPKHINFLDAAAGMRMNENGELVDPWGTPYFFHQISGQEMEIRSAGADGKMWTADDLVTH